MASSLSPGIGRRPPNHFCKPLPRIGRISASASKASSPGTWRADRCAREGLPVGLGHALYMKACHGGKAKHEQIAAQKIAVWLRGGMRPQASGYPAARRATRALLRRRRPLMHQRAERLAQIQQTKRQAHLPELGTQLASKANRQGVAARVPEPAGQKRSAVALALIDHGDPRLRAIELGIRNTAPQQDRNTLSLLRTIPGIGESLSLVLRADLHASQRFPRVPAFVSDCRLGKCARESAGQRYGPSGTKMGNADLKWACSEAAVRFWRANPAGQNYLARLEKNYRQGKALTILAHKVARAVYSMLKRHTALDMATFLRGYGRAAGEPSA
jgi:transposase